MSMAEERYAALRSTGVCKHYPMGACVHVSRVSAIWARPLRRVGLRSSH